MRANVPSGRSLSLMTMLDKEVVSNYFLHIRYFGLSYKCADGVISGEELMTCLSCVRDNLTRYVLIFFLFHFRNPVFLAGALIVRLWT